MSVSYHITDPCASSNENEPLVKAIALAARLADEKAEESILLVYQTYGVADNTGGVFAKVLGSDRAADRLLKDRSYNSRPPLKIANVKDIPWNHRGPVVMVFPDTKMFEAVTELNSRTAEIAVPWTPEKCDVWRAAHNPQLVGSSKADAAPSTPSLDPAVMRALKSLSMLVNFHNGMVNREKADTIRVLGAVLAHRPRIDTKAVVAALMGPNKWPPKMAEEAGEILDKLKAGRSFPGYDKPNPDDFLRFDAEEEAK
jgi:hypothetical protein